MTDNNDLKIKNDTEITGILKETGSVPSEAGAIDASGSGISVSSPVTAPEPGRRALSLRKGKDINVELLRVIACLMVIVTHVRPMIISADLRVMDSVLLMQTLAAPAVGIFFLIAGFFAPRSSNFLRSWKKYLTSVLLPAILLAIATDYLEDWIQGSSGIIRSIMEGDLYWSLRNVFECLISLDAGPFGLYNAHLWYVFTYMLIMLFLPVMCVLARHADRRVLWFFAILVSYRLIIVDIETLTGSLFRIYQTTILPPELAIFMLGYLVYSGLSPCRGRRLTAIAAALSLAVIFSAMFIFQKKLYADMLADPSVDVTALNTSSPYFLTWVSGLSVLAAIAITVLVLSLPLKGEWLYRILGFAGELTYPVYLVHFPILAKLITSGLQLKLYGRFAGSGAGELIYTVLMTIIVYVLSMLLSFSIRFVWHHIRKGLSAVLYRLRKAAD